jgi:hypothetical protein
MSSKVFRLKSKQPTGDLPKGYEFQVIIQNKSGVDDKDIRNTLEKLGFQKASKSAMKSYFEIIS